MTFSISPIVFDTEDGQNISDEIKKQGIEAVIIHVPIWATPSLAFRIAYGTSYPVLLLGNLQRNYVQPCNTVGSWGYVGPDRKEVYPCIR